MRLVELEVGITYLDANVLIYAYEGHATLAPLLRRLLNQVSANNFQVLTSELTLAEVLVRPIRVADVSAIALYESLLSQSPLQVRLVDRATLVRAAEIRALVGSKLPDAIHAAAAELTGCARLLTADISFRAPPSMPVVLLQDLTL